MPLALAEDKFVVFVLSTAQQVCERQGLGFCFVSLFLLPNYIFLFTCLLVCIAIICVYLNVINSIFFTCVVFYNIGTANT